MAKRWLPWVAGAGLFCACVQSDHRYFGYNRRGLESGELAATQKELDEVQRKINSGELPKIQFEFDSAEITEESYPTLDAVADILLRHPELKLVVLAHTCNMGGEDYNLKLSKRRGLAVEHYLVKKGIPPPFIHHIGKGLSEPIADNSTEQGRSKNRRVEFRVTDRDWESVY
ncbi:MAG: OmpA family protein [Elusimicrobia bacterium]|nr:OmpA family protein [Elusimicrobiota bacterium]